MIAITPLSEAAKRAIDGEIAEDEAIFVANGESKHLAFEHAHMAWDNALDDAAEIWEQE